MLVSANFLFAGHGLFIVIVAENMQLIYVKNLTQKVLEHKRLFINVKSYKF